MLLLQIKSKKQEDNNTNPFKKNDLPGGGTRLTVEPLGIKGVWINGVRVVEDCNLIDEENLPGKLIRAFHA